MTAQQLDTLAVAVFQNARDNEPKQHQLSWDKLTAKLMLHEERKTKDGPLWSPTLYRPGTLRGKANVESVSCLVLDFDKGTPPAEFTRGWDAWAYVLHTTFQHTEEQPRWRVVFPLSTPVAGEHWPAAWEGLVKRFAGSVVDSSCRDASRIYYLPACPPGADRDAWANDGRWIDPSEFLRPSPAVLVERARDELPSGRNNAGMWLACQMRDNGYSQSETERLDWHREVPAARQSPTGQIDEYTEGEWLETVRKVFGRGKRDPWRPSTNGTHHPDDDPFVASVASVAGVTQESAPPIDLEAEAFHGLPGEIVQAIEPHTESSAAAILASLIVGVGCLIGRGPHVHRDGANHAGNEFAILVGPTATGKKGTAGRRIDELLSYCDCINSTKTQYAHGTYLEHDSIWFSRMVRGLGSGEALVESAAEPDERIDRGPSDRRRIVFESEFSKSLKVMRRDGSTLSETLRDAWDGGVIANRTKGKRLEARGAHISVLAHITEEELRLQMGSVEMFNGFANRFLWFCTHQSKVLPFGGGDVGLATLVRKLHETLEFARKQGRMEFSKDAKAIWGDGGIYQMLGNRPKGLLGAVTSRAQPHVLRLSLIYAVLDLEAEIKPAHLLAALAVWEFSEASCRYLFGGSSGDDYADTIEELLQEAFPGALTRTELRDRFGRHAQAGRIPKALAALHRAGKVEMSISKTPGRPVEYWRWAMREGRDRSDKSDKSPLQRARELAEQEGLQ